MFGCGYVLLTFCSHFYSGDYDLSKIGLPKEDLECYRHNHVFLGYLSPKDYHRVHSPIEVSSSLSEPL